MCKIYPNLHTWAFSGYYFHRRRWQNILLEIYGVRKWSSYGGGYFKLHKPITVNTQKSRNPDSKKCKSTCEHQFTFKPKLLRLTSKCARLSQMSCFGTSIQCKHEFYHLPRAGRQFDRLKYLDMCEDVIFEIRGWKGHKICS